MIFAFNEMATVKIRCNFDNYSLLHKQLLILMPLAIILEINIINYCMRRSRCT